VYTEPERLRALGGIRGSCGLGGMVRVWWKYKAASAVPGRGLRRPGSLAPGAVFGTDAVSSDTGTFGNAAKDATCNTKILHAPNFVELGHLAGEEGHLAGEEGLHIMLGELSANIVGNNRHTVP
jgi:hypothetical protein